MHKFQWILVLKQDKEDNEVNKPTHFLWIFLCKFPKSDVRKRGNAIRHMKNINKSTGIIIFLVKNRFAAQYID